MKNVAASSNEYLYMVFIVFIVYVRQIPSYIKHADAAFIPTAFLPESGNPRCSWSRWQVQIQKVYV